MKSKSVMLVSFAVVSIALIGLIIVHYNPISKVYSDRALNVIESLNSGDYEKATRDFNQRKKERQTPKQLRDDWRQITDMWGQLKSYKIASMKEETAYRDSVYSVLVKCQFERKTGLMFVYFDPFQYITEVGFCD